MILTCLRIAGTCPPNYLCSKQVWESWWTVYHTDNLLYTLYAADQVNTISIALSNYICILVYLNIIINAITLALVMIEAIARTSQLRLEFPFHHLLHSISRSPPSCWF